MKIDYVGPALVRTAKDNMMREFINVSMRYRRLRAGARMNNLRVSDWRQKMADAEASAKTMRAVCVALYGERGLEEMIHEFLPTDFKLPA